MSDPLHLFFVCYFYIYTSYVQSPSVSFYENFMNVHRGKKRTTKPLWLKVGFLPL